MRVNHSVLTNFLASALCQVSVPDASALITAKALVEADLRGVDSHGSVLLPLYISRIKKGEITAHRKIEVVKMREAIILLDGNNGLGHPTASYAMDLAMDGASKFGASWVGVRGSNHFGMAAYYAMKALKKDMIGIVLTVSNINTMAPFGGLDLLLGNNPIAFAIPAGKELPIVFDAAWSVAARRKIHDAKAANKNIPEGWATDSLGQPTIDPQKALDGLLIPVGGHKGYGFAFIVSILAGALTGAAFGKLVNNSNVGHLIGAIDVNFFSDVLRFKAAVDGAIGEIHNSRRMNGVLKILVSGERGFLTKKERSEKGIPLRPLTVEALNKLAEELNIEKITLA